MDKTLKSRLAGIYSNSMADIVVTCREAIVEIEELERAAMPVLALPPSVIAEINHNAERYNRLLDNVRYLRESFTDTRAAAIYKEKIKSGEISTTFAHRLQCASQTLPSDLDTVTIMELEFALKIMGEKEIQ